MSASGRARNGRGMTSRPTIDAENDSSAFATAVSYCSQGRR